MKKLNLMIIVTVFSVILFCSCAQNNDVMASVNGIDIKKSDYEVRLKSNEVMSELLKYSLQGTTQGNGLTGGVPPVRFSM